MEVSHLLCLSLLSKKLPLKNALSFTKVNDRDEKVPFRNFLQR